MITIRANDTNSSSNGALSTGNPLLSAVSFIASETSMPSPGLATISPLAPASINRPNHAACYGQVRGIPAPVVMTRSPAPTHSHGSGRSTAWAHETGRPPPEEPAKYSIFRSAARTRLSTVITGRPVLAPSSFLRVHTNIQTLSRGLVGTKARTTNRTLVYTDHYRTPSPQNDSLFDHNRHPPRTDYRDETRPAMPSTQ